MTRRTGLMAIFSVLGELIHANQQSGNTATTELRLMSSPKDLTIFVGNGQHGFERFHVTDGNETITFTSQELMAALKADAK